MVTPKEIIPDKYRHLYNGLWYVYTECNYTGCSKSVYGDENSIVGMSAFCPCHYNIIVQFLNSNANT